MAFLNKLRKIARNAYVRVSLRLFGNTISPRINFLYFGYTALIGAKSFFVRLQKPRGGWIKNNEELLHLSSLIKEGGFAKMEPVCPSQKLQNLSQKLDTLFSSPEKVVASLDEGGLTRLKNCLIEVPEIEEMLLDSKVTDVIHHYFGSYFKVFSCDIYRTKPADPEKAKDLLYSLHWHFDNIPKAVLKLMIYLRDTKKETGALTVVPKPASLEIQRKGFWDRTERKDLWKEIEEKAISLEGPAGSLLFFSTHYCIHKATLPLRDYRDVAVFLLQPSFKKQEAFTDASRKTFSRNFGYCINPFSNVPLRSGDE